MRAHFGLIRWPRGWAVWWSLLLASLVALQAPAAAQGVDVESLDQISVSMPRAEARRLLGEPDSVATIEPGLTAELYLLEAPEAGLLAKGLLYDGAGNLAGHSLIFDGAVGSVLAELLLERGYRASSEQLGGPIGAQIGTSSWRLLGADDDTGRPQLVQIDEDSPYTILTVLEQQFFTAQRAR
jgi:hypothetical protein